MNNRPLPFDRTDVLLIAAVVVVLFLATGARL
jgi:hypothetical protein